MKSRVITLVILAHVTVFPELFSQNVAINSTGSMPETSAMLDVSSTSKGFLLPRMTTTQQDAIVLPATGLAIFNTTLNIIKVNTGTPSSPVWSSLTTTQSILDTSNIADFYLKVRSLTTSSTPIVLTNGLIGITQASTSSNGYLNSTDWNTFNNKWSTTGNTGISYSTSFIGTTDSKSLRFRTNNAEGMILDSLGNVGIGTTIASTKLDVNGAVKLGAKGTVEKNVISFEVSFPSNTSVPAASLNIILSTFSPGTLEQTVTIPAANTPTTTRGSVSISPDQDLPSNVSIAAARVSTTSAVKVRFLNSGTVAQTIPSGLKLYITITEF